LVTAPLRLGTRGSLLALTQSRWIAAGIERTTGTRVEIVIFETKGDKVLDRPLPEIGGKGLFTEELDRALLEGDVDLAVHSLKDLPTDSVDGLALACIPVREDSRDALVGPAGNAVSLSSLPSGAVVGTSSVRRAALLGAFRSDVSARNVRGNLDTRLRKLDEGGYDALLLAAAGLKRLGLGDRIGESLERTSWLPAPGQGALGVVTRSGDAQVQSLLSALHHPETASAVSAERALLRHLEGGCQVPVGALGMPYEGGIRLWGLVVSPDGRHLARVDLTGEPGQEAALGARVGEALLARGAREILDELAGNVPMPSPP